MAGGGGQHQTCVDGRNHTCNLVILEYPQGQGKHLASGGLDGHLDGLPGANTAFLHVEHGIDNQVL